MGIAVKVYEAFKEDENKAKVLLELVEELESRIPSDISTRADLELTKLALQKEIEEVRLSLQKEIEEVRLSLQKEIEEVRAKIEEVKLSLQKEIEEVRANLIKWVAGLMVVQTGVIVSLITLLK